MFPLEHKIMLRNFVLEVEGDIDPYRVSTLFGYFLFEYKFKNMLKEASIPIPKA